MYICHPKWKLKEILSSQEQAPRNKICNLSNCQFFLHRLLRSNKTLITSARFILDFDFEFFHLSLVLSSSLVLMFDKGPLHWSLSQSLILKIKFDGIGSTWPCLVWSKSNTHPCTLHIASTILQNSMSSSFFSKRRTFTLPSWSFHLKSSFWSDHISHWRQKSKTPMPNLFFSSLLRIEQILSRLRLPWVFHKMICLL